MFLNVLIEEYHRVYHNIDDENSKMVCLRHEMDNGTVDAFELLKACVKNRHFDFLHLKRDEKALENPERTDPSSQCFTDP